MSYKTDINTERKQTMQDFKIDIKLIYKKIEGRINTEENRLFEEWYQDRKHQQYFNKIRTYYELQHEPSIEKEETETAWKKLKERIQTDIRSRKHRIWKTCSAAASIILLLALYQILMNLSTNEHKTDGKAEIIPGRHNAILELADGSSLNLNRLTQENKTRIEQNVHIDSNRLSYRHRSKDNRRKLEFNKISVPRGGEFQLILSDSTKVWLNSDSRLRFPIAFGSDKREIYLEGEAYFEVSKDSLRPFIIYTETQKVTVLGTSFGITSYPRENYETTTLTEGSLKVEFPQHDNKEYMLTPGLQIRYDRNAKEITRKQVSTDEFTAWKDGKYVFKKKRLEDMLNTLGRWYDFQVFYQNDECKEILFSGEIQRFANFNSILNLLRKSSDADFTVTGNTVQVRKKF